MGDKSTAQDVEKATSQFTKRMVNEYEERKTESMREFRLYRVWGLVVGVGLISPTASSPHNSAPRLVQPGNRGRA